jgi:hypothetical protein
MNMSLTPTTEELDSFIKQFNLVNFSVDIPRQDFSSHGYSYAVNTGGAMVKMEAYMPDFYHLVNIVSQRNEEQMIRDRSETVRKAYEEYLILLKLSR